MLSLSVTMWNSLEWVSEVQCIFLFFLISYNLQEVINTLV